MKNGVVVVVVAGALLLSASGSTLAAGKMGGASGMDVAGRSGPVLAGKLGGAGGADEFQVTDPDDASGDGIVLGAKIGGGSDRPTSLGAKLGMGSGEE